MIQTILVLMYLLLVPLGVMQLSKRWTWIDKITPMTVLYVVGLTFGNTILIDPSMTEVCGTVSNLAVPLCLPLMLFGCSFKNWSAPNALKAFLTGLVSIIIVTVAGFFLFGNTKDPMMHEEFAKVAAVSTGIYTGGIPNIAAIAKGVSLSDNLYIILTSYDLIATGCYLIFVIFLGKQFFRWVLPVGRSAADTPMAVESEAQQSDSWKKKLLLALLTVVVAGISYGITVAVCGELNIAVLILILTTLSLLLAQVKAVNDQNSSFDMGLYVVYVFCLAIASMVNIQELKIFDHLNILWYIFFVIFGSILLQVILAKIFKIDGDTVMVSSVALINSPPFVPMVAGILGNRQVVITGISIGLLGYAMGNYLALGLYQLLLLL